VATSLHIVTLAPERHVFAQLRVSYVFADVRDLPYADETFDVVTCISTLEHVGMDNSRYGGPSIRDDDHWSACVGALNELLRVTRRGGRVLVTVPYGRPDDLGWMRVFGREDVEQVASVATEATVAVFAYAPHGWYRSNLDDAADVTYRQRALDRYPADLAVTARAVACVELRVPGSQ
jgi:SAM-dependent methyltransferase